MFRAVVLGALLLMVAASLAADPKATPPPLAARPPQSLFEPANRPPTLWHQLQDPMDRSTGRIEDEPSYQLGRIERDRLERLGQLPPQSESERTRQERERWLRLDERARDEAERQYRSERERREAMDRREYELYLNAGLTPLAGQVNSDAMSLQQAKSQRDAQLIQAQNERDQVVAKNPGERAAADAELERRVEEIGQRYESQREAILGFARSTPTSQPSTLP
jgi:hypothetical protein